MFHRNTWIVYGDLPLFNCEIELDLSWSRYCIITEIDITPEVPANRASNSFTTLISPTWSKHFNHKATFQKNSTKIYVSVVTLSINDNIKILEIWSKHLKEQYLGIDVDIK